MTVHVIFSDGSRQLSHNTDDLRERWELRQELDSVVLRHESAIGYQIPILENLDDYDAILKMVALYRDMLRGIEARSRIIQGFPTYSHEFGHLMTLKAEIGGQLGTLNARIKQENIRRSNSEDRTYINELKPYIRALERRVLELGGDLPDAPERWRHNNELRLVAPSIEIRSFNKGAK